MIPDLGTFGKLLTVLKGGENELCPFCHTQMINTKWVFLVQFLERCCCVHFLPGEQGMCVGVCVSVFTCVSGEGRARGNSSSCFALEIVAEMNCAG